MYKFTTQFDFDFINSDKHSHSDEIITIPDDSFTIEELMQRAIANTLPPLANHYDDDYNDDEVSFEDELQFYTPSDFSDLIDMKNQLDNRINELRSELNKEVTLAQEKEANKSSDTSDTDL